MARYLNKKYMITVIGEGTKRAMHWGNGSGNIGKYIGYVYQEVDGFFVFVPDSIDGFWSEHSLRCISDTLKDLNKEWNNNINDYFKNIKPL